MPLPQHAFFHLRLKTFSVRDVPALVPTLTATVSLSASSSGSGGTVSVIRKDATDLHFDLLAVETTLLWAQGPPKSPTGMAVVGRGFTQSLRTPRITLDARYSVDLEFDFPLPPAVLSTLEELRGGGEPKFAISARLTGLATYDIEAPGVMKGGSPFLSPFVAEDLQVVAFDSGSYVLGIERSQWIEKLLPGLGFGRWMLYEVPVENFDGSAQVDVYLRNAVKQFLAGEYKLSIAASRDVVETLERELGANANPAFGDRFGSADKKFRKVADTFSELAQAIMAYQSALKSLLAAGAHPERPDELVERPDAEMALWVALSLRRYVGMRLRASRPPATGQSSGS